MKNIALLIAVIITFGFASCGDEKKKKRKRKKGPTLCDCVNEKNPSDECKKMEIEWSEKFKDASEEERKGMATEAEDCMHRYQKSSDKRKEVKREEVMRADKSIEVIDATLVPLEVDDYDDMKVDEFDPESML